jgi:hypothetical protein
MRVDDASSETSGDSNTHSKHTDGFTPNTKLLTNRRRVGAFLPAHEGAFFDSTNVIASVSAVASSVVEPPAER